MAVEQAKLEAKAISKVKEQNRYEFVPKRKVWERLNQEELAGPIKEDAFRMGLMASRPQKIAQILETQVSFEGDE